MLPVRFHVNPPISIVQPMSNQKMIYKFVLVTINFLRRLYLSHTVMESSTRFMVCRHLCIQQEFYLTAISKLVSTHFTSYQQRVTCIVSHRTRRSKSISATSLPVAYNWRPYRICKPYFYLFTRNAVIQYYVLFGKYVGLSVGVKREDTNRSQNSFLK